MSDKENAQEMIETFLETGDINELEDISLYYDGDWKKMDCSEQSIFYSRFSVQERPSPNFQNIHAIQNFFDKIAN